MAPPRSVWTPSSRLGLSCACSADLRFMSLENIFPLGFSSYFHPGRTRPRPVAVRKWTSLCLPEFLRGRPFSSQFPVAPRLFSRSHPWILPPTLPKNIMVTSRAGFMRVGGQNTPNSVQRSSQHAFPAFLPLIATSRPNTP